MKRLRKKRYCVANAGRKTSVIPRVHALPTMRVRRGLIVSRLHIPPWRKKCLNDAAHMVRGTTTSNNAKPLRSPRLASVTGSSIRPPPTDHNPLRSARKTRDVTCDWHVHQNPCRVTENEAKWRLIWLHCLNLLRGRPDVFRCRKFWTSAATPAKTPSKNTHGLTAWNRRGFYAFCIWLRYSRPVTPYWKLTV